ncbi:MAG: PIG-L family deacetylase [Acidobacteriota bacterium]
MKLILFFSRDKFARKARFRVTALLCAFAILLSPLVHQHAAAQETVPAATKIDKAELHQALLDLTNPWTVMCVAAHPDDEDGTMLTVLRRKYGAHTISLFSTYGEGGQNAVGPQLYEELGVIRAHETMAAAKIQGSEPYFLGLKDFGFSKTAEEAFRVWGHDEALRRMVLKIRELRPDVIITNHDTTSGHGHHQATGRLILEAFDAAANSQRFPEQLRQFSVWQPKRLFVRMFSGSAATDKSQTAAPAKIISVDPNEVDPVRGTSYAAQALAALQRHATQGPWPRSIAEMLKARRIETGKLPNIHYLLVRESPGSNPLPENATDVLDGLKLPKTFASLFAPPMIEQRPLTEFVGQPDRALNALIDWRRRHPPILEAGGDEAPRVRLMAARGDRALAVSSGSALTLNARSSVLVPGVITSFVVNLANTGDRTVQINKVSFDSWGEKANVEAAEQLSADTETISPVDRVTPEAATMTVPAAEHLYDGLFLGQRFASEAALEIDGAKFSLSARTNLPVAPAVEITEVWPSPYVWTPNTRSRPIVLRVTLTNNLASPFRGLTKITGPQYRIFEFGSSVMLGPQEKRALTLQSNALPIETSRRHGRSGTKPGQLTLSVLNTNVIKPVTERELRVLPVDARVAAGLKVGYVPSFDTTLAQALSALGVNAKELSIKEIQEADLAAYDTIVIDNRGYQAHPELMAANSRLLSYVEGGGTLLVFYQKDNEWNPNPDRGRPQLAPYPIILGGERVTDETAPIKILQPGHPLLNYPNRISSADFKDWIQERGLYYPKEWDPHYTALFASNDTGGAQLLGGLLVAHYGSGNYLYTSMVWYRQLAAGVPGGYRMFANMISYGRSQKRKARISVP